MGGLLGIPTAMRDLLKLTQWLSPAFPIGSFAYSHGLEYAIDQGDISSADTLFDWVEGVILFGAGRSDAALLRLTLEGADVADQAEAICSSSERWLETVEQGRAFVTATNAVYTETLPPMPLPIAVGVVARRLELSAETVVSLYLHSFASNLVSVAVRFVPLGQSDGQSVLHRLHEVIEQVAQAEPSLWAGAIGSDLASLRHQQMETRVFKT